MLIEIKDEYTFKKSSPDDNWFTLEMKEFGMVMSPKEKFLEAMDVTYSVAMLVGKVDFNSWEEKMERYSKIRSRIEDLLK